MSSSREDLDEHINSLNSELVACGKDIMGQLSAIYSGNNQNTKVDLKPDSHNMLKLLQHDVAEVLQAAKERTNFNAKHKQQLMECSQMVDIVEGISVISEKVAVYEKYINAVNLIDACTTLIEIETLIQGLPGSNTEIGSGLVCTQVRKEARIQKSRLLSKFKRVLSEAVRFERGHISVAKEVKGMLRSEDIIVHNGMDLQLLWGCLCKIGRLDEFVESILSSLWSCILRPLWHLKKCPTPKVHSRGSAAELHFEGIIAAENHSSSSSKLLT